LVRRPDRREPACGYCGRPYESVAPNTTFFRFFTDLSTRPGA
jgi:hypothetical protein